MVLTTGEEGPEVVDSSDRLDDADLPTRPFELWALLDVEFEKGRDRIEIVGGREEVVGVDAGIRQCVCQSTSGGISDG